MWRRDPNLRYRHGQYKQVDDRSGFDIYSDESRKEWNGLVVHRRHRDERNPQDFVRGRKDVQTVAFASPEADDVFLDTNDVQPDTDLVPSDYRITDDGAFRVTADGSLRRVG